MFVEQPLFALMRLVIEHAKARAIDADSDEQLKDFQHAQPSERVSLMRFIELFPESKRLYAVPIEELPEHVARSAEHIDHLREVEAGVIDKHTELLLA